MVKEELAARMTGDALFDADCQVALPSPGLVEQRGLALRVRASREGCDVYVVRPG